MHTVELRDGTSLVDEVVEALDHRLESIVSRNEIELQRKYGLDALVSVYVEALPRIKNAHGRIQVMFWLQRYARRDFRVADAAVDRLRDKSTLVRSYACGAIAYSVSRDLLPSLMPLLNHPVAATQADAEAAIDAIEHQNHHLFVDRNHSGSTFWILNPGDAPEMP